MRSHLCFAASLLLAGSIAFADSKNLLPEPGMEGAPVKGLPTGWEKAGVGADKSKFAIDTEVKHEGNQSVRITSTESTRAYVRSIEPIPVAPGEKINGSFWVKCKDVPLEPGAIIAIADFSNSDDKGNEETVAKFDTAKIAAANKGWYHISGSVKVPELAANLRVRLGFTYSKGTCWWDDTKVTAAQPIVARIELPGERLVPAMSKIPVTIINREGKRADARVTVMFGKTKSELAVKLNGQPLQHVDVPLNIAKRGKEKLSATVFVGGPSTTSFTDDREVSVPPAVVLGPPSPTHWVNEDGPPSIEGRVDLALSDEQRAGATLAVRVEDADGKTRAIWKSKSVADGVQTFTLKPPGTLLMGPYKLVAEIKPAKGEALRAEQAWSIIPRRLAKVTLNDAGFPVYDGKAILPLGMFNGGKFKEMAESGFTITHAYNAVRIHDLERPEDAYAKKFIDETADAGMKMLFMIPMKLAIDGNWDAVRTRVRMFRNHPALLAWDEEEGFARGDFKPDSLKKIRQIVKEEDPNHPFMVGDSGDVIGKILPDRSNLFPAEDMDMGMWWWYPLPLGPKKGDALQGEELSKSYEMTPPSFLVNAKTTKPIWLGVQSYKRKDSRFPTPTEYRAQAYIGLIHGAKGLMWYGGSVSGGILSAPEKKEDKEKEKPYTEQGHWTELKGIVKEVSDLAPLIMGTDEPPPTVSPQTALISVRIKRAGERKILMAANRGNTPVSVSLESPVIRAGSIAVLGEKRTITADGGRIEDTFEPYGVHVYELR